MKLKVLLSTMQLQMKQSFARPMFKFCLLLNPILNTILLYEMFKNSNNENYFAFVVLGSGLMALWGCICFSSAGDINRERYSGTLALIFTAPASFPYITLGKILGNTLLSLATFLISLATATLIFRVPVYIANPGWFAIAFLVMLSSFVVISIAIAYILTLSRKTELYMNCIELPFVLLCGFVFPVDILPEWLQNISMLLAPTHAVSALRQTIYGIEDVSILIRQLGYSVGLSVICSLLSVFLYNKIDKHVRIKGTLNVA